MSSTALNSWLVRNDNSTVKMKGFGKLLEVHGRVCCLVTISLKHGFFLGKTFRGANQCFEK